MIGFFRKPGLRNDSIHSYERQAGGVRRVDFESFRRDDQAPVAIDSISLEQLESTQKSLQKERRAELKGGRPQPVSPVVAKDNTPDPSAFHMAYDPADSTSLGFVSQMAAVGQVEDFRVVASCPEGHEKKLLRKLPRENASNVSVLTNPGSHDTWAEDHGEFTDGGEMVIPAVLPADFPIEEVIQRDRMRRFYPDAPRPKLLDFNPYPKVKFSSLGAVTDRVTQQEALAAAMASGARRYKMAVSYVEGGNFMPGRRQDGTPFALVGKDSLAVTAEILRKAGKQGHSPADARNQVAKDYGLDRRQVIAVEQPGEFHLDMAMALAGPGQVLLNDARAVAEIQKDWIEQHYAQRWIQWGKKSQLEAIEKRAERLAEYEAMVESDLKRAGLQVYRIPGCFPASKANSEMNFFNLRQGRNEQGEVFALALGGDERAEQAFAHTLLGEIPAGYQRIHFLDRELTEPTLDMSGGIKCRTKGRVDPLPGLSA